MITAIPTKIYFLYNLFSISSLIYYILFVSSNISSNQCYISLLQGTLFICSQFQQQMILQSIAGFIIGLTAAHREHSQLWQDFSKKGLKICTFKFIQNIEQLYIKISLSDVSPYISKLKFLNSNRHIYFITNYYQFRRNNLLRTTWSLKVVLII